MPRSDPDGSAPPARDAGARPPVIAALTGIRALAAAWVVLHHLSEPIFRLLPALGVARPVLAQGFLGVDVFFVLSGFIISYNYASSLGVAPRRLGRTFLVARFARLYPAHLATFLVTAALVIYAGSLGKTLTPNADYDAVEFVGNVFMLQGLPGIAAWNVPSWSIACEAAAYLVFPLAAGLLVRLDRRVAAALAVALVVAELAAISAVTDVPSSAGYVALNWVRIAAEFALGCLLWACTRQGVTPRRRWDAVAVVTAAASMLVVVGLPGPVTSFLAVPLLALGVVAVAFSTGPVRTLLVSRPFQWTGRVSYSWYLAQYPATLVLFGLVDGSRHESSSPVVRAAVVATWVLGTVAAGAITYYVVEEPGRRWLRGRRDRGAAGTPEPGHVARPAPDDPVTVDRQPSR